MQKQDWLSLVRTLLVAAGAWLVGVNVLGSTITAELWQEILGAVIALGTAIWGIADKTSGWEQVESATRSALTVVGGFIVAKGKVTAQQWLQIMGVASALIMFISSYAAKRKSKDVVTGKIQGSQLTLPNKKAA